jgi:hypothetical protein
MRNLDDHGSIYKKAIEADVNQKDGGFDYSQCQNIAVINRVYKLDVAYKERHPG